MKRFSVLLIFILCFALPLLAQENEPTPYEIALQRIEEARVSGATELSLSNISLSDIPHELWTLTQLRVLDLGGDVNRSLIQELPAELGNLENLEILRLNGNTMLEALPPEIARLRNLRGLDLTMTGIREFPSDMVQLTSLEWLVYNVNDSIPDVLLQMTNLQELYLTHNTLTSLPAEIGNLVNLRLLDLRDNQLERLPPEIGNLESLEVLRLNHNHLVSLPPEIGQLHQLKILDLSVNRISQLPPEIANLQNLCHLDLNWNRLNDLPSEMGIMLGLTMPHTESMSDICYVGVRRLGLAGNPLESFPYDVIEQGTAAILAYLRNEAWWHLQRLIAGAAGAVGMVAAIVLGLRWKSRRGRKEKEKRG